MLTTLEKIGIVCIAIVGFQIVRVLMKIIYDLIIMPHIGRINSEKLRDMGKYALITGATDGLGKAYAEYLASKGINIILVSRTMEKLKNVAEELEEKYKIETKVIQADFCGDLDIYEQIEKQCLGLEIGILINNVGLSYPHPEYFLSVPRDSKLFENIVKCNVTSVNKMCEIIMPGMVERKKGVVINISSATALIPSPMLTVYGATKAYVDKFSSDLAVEYAHQGIIVQCILPGFIATKMSKIRSATWMAPSPKTFVIHAMKTIGIKEQTTGYYAHSLLVGVIHLIESISQRLARWFILRTMENIRARAVRRYIS